MLYLTGACHDLRTRNARNIDDWYDDFPSCRQTWMGSFQPTNSNHTASITSSQSTPSGQRLVLITVPLGQCAKHVPNTSAPMCFCKRFPWVRASIGKKHARDHSERSSIRKCFFGAVLEDEVGKKTLETLVRAPFYSTNVLLCRKTVSYCWHVLALRDCYRATIVCKTPHSNLSPRSSAWIRHKVSALAADVFLTLRFQGFRMLEVHITQSGASQ